MADPRLFAGSVLAASVGELALGVADCDVPSPADRGRRTDDPVGAAFPMVPIRRWTGARCGRHLLICHGFVFWPVALFVLLTIPAPAGKTRPVALAFWLFTTIVVYGLYLAGFRMTDLGTAGLSAATMASRYIRFVFVYLGSPLAGKYGMAFGVFGVALLVALPYVLVRFRGMPFGELLPFLAIGLYSIGTALVTGAGRIAYGSEWGSASRYTTVGNLLWVADLVFLFLVWRDVGGRSPTASSATVSDRSFPKAAGTVFLAVVILVGVGYAPGIKGFQSFHVKFAPAREQVLLLEDDALLSRLNPLVGVLREDLIPMLQERRLSVFRNTQGAR